MIGLTTAFGGLGTLVIASFLQNTIPRRPMEYFGMALATGIALVILIAIGLNLFRIPLTKNNLTIAILSVCGLCLLRILQKRSRLRMKWSPLSNQNLAEIILPIALFVILLFLRLLQIREVFVPNWYEGLTHTALLQEYTMRSAFPFENIYHVGFQTFALVVHTFSGITFPQTILLSGQWLSVVCGLSLYIFARRYIRNVYAAGLSFAVYSFVLLFPSLLISWGRYPYLLGLALLLPAIATSQDWINDSRTGFGETLIFVMAIGVTHYGMLLIWYSFIVVYFVHQIISMRRFLPELLGRRKAGFIPPFLLIFPALIVLLPTTFGSTYQHFIQNDLLSQIYNIDFQFGIRYVSRLFRTHDGFFILLWVCWVLWSFFWKRKLLYLTLFWPLATGVLIWIQRRLIGNSILTYENLIVFLSIPLSLSIGLLAQQLSFLLIKLDSSSSQPVARHQVKSRFSILLIGTMLISALSSPLSLDQKTALVNADDMLAMKWISDHTARDSGFLIRTISGFNNTLIPADGGGWIPYLTGRRVVIPQLGELYDLCEFALDHDVDYLYFGKQGAPDSFDLRLSDLDTSSYIIVYGSDSVEIASLNCL